MERERRDQDETRQEQEAERTANDPPEGAASSGASQIEDSTQPSAEDERVEELLARTIDVPVLASAIEAQEAADAADSLEKLDEEEAVEVLEQMDEQSAAEALAEMQTPLAIGVIEDLVEEDRAYAARLIELMAPDDAADLLQAVEPARSEALLAALPIDEAAELRRLMRYAQDSAGGLMTTEYPVLRGGMSITDAIDVIRENPIPEGMQHLPVINADGKLVGIIGLRDLLIGQPRDRVASLMERSVKVARASMDREEVAREFDRYDHAMLPVVDDQERLVGVVTVDDVIDIIRAEQTEDVQMTVGAGAGEAVYSGLMEKLRGRFPWLGVSLGLTALAATVVLLWEDLISERPMLAFLMPVIAALVGNAGHQALAVTLRGIVLEEVRPDLLQPLLVREAVVGLINGLGLGFCVFVMVGGLSELGSNTASWPLGMVAGIATAIAMTVGTFSGSCVPLIMRRVGFDPAHASAIFLIMITDAVSFTVLLGLTLVMLGRVSGG